MTTTTTRRQLANRVPQGPRPVGAPRRSHPLLRRRWWRGRRGDRAHRRQRVVVGRVRTAPQVLSRLGDARGVRPRRAPNREPHFGSTAPHEIEKTLKLKVFCMIHEGVLSAATASGLPPVSCRQYTPSHSSRRANYGPPQPKRTVRRLKIATHLSLPPSFPEQVDGA